MSFKKILAVMLAAVTACGISAHALTLDVAEVANEAVLAETAVLAADALPAAVDGVITLTEDVVLSQTLTITADTTIDLAGHKITTADTSDAEKLVSKLIYVSGGATLTVKDSLGGGVIVGGTRTNTSAYNGLYRTIEVDGANLVVEGARIEGSKGINTKYGADAIYASNGSVVTITNAVVKGGDVEKNGITKENYETFNYRNEGVSGNAVYLHSSTATITGSTISGGNGKADENSDTAYISGGANFANGGLGIYVAQANASVTVNGSTVTGGNSDLNNAENAIYVGFGAALKVNNSEITGGSCFGNNGRGIAGAGVEINMGTSDVVITESEVTGGSTDGSWIGSGIETGSNSEANTIKIESSTIAAGSGKGDGNSTYAIKANGSDDIASVELKDVTLETNSDVNGKAISTSVGSVSAEGTLTIEGGTLGKVTVETTDGVTIEGDDTATVVKIVAKVNGIGYGTLADAIAVGGEITLLSDVALTEKTAFYKEAVIDLNGHTITMTAELNSDWVQNDYGSCAYAFTKPVTFKNGTMIVSNVDKLNNDIGVFYIKYTSLTFDDIDFISNGYNAYSMFNLSGTLSFVNGTTVDVKNNADQNNFISGDSYPKVVINDSTLNIENTGRFIVNSTLETENSDITISNLTENALRNVKGTINNTNIDANGYASGLKNDSGHTLTVSGNSVVTLTGFNGDGEYDLYIKEGATLTVTDPAVVIAGKSLIEADDAVSGNVITKANTIAVSFVKADAAEEDGAIVDTEEEYDLYNIVLDGTNETINRLNSGDLTFTFTHDKAMAYEIVDIAGDNITVTNVEGDRYEFHFDTKTGVTNDTASKIIIAQVKFTGYGVYSFAVTDGVVHATTIRDNIVDTFVPNGSASNEGELDISDDTITDIEIAVPTRLLTINVTFPNAVVENTPEEQQMTVKVSGGDLAEEIVVDLGNKTFTGTTDEADVDTDDDTVTFNGAYEVVLGEELTKNVAYNVEVSGAGYRTARYTVTMTEDKVLNFWNNVKDNNTAVEEGKYETTKNFLAGDIVGDNNINIYDLSAVVSYFATETSADYAKYVKYDLNRDGVIDSKDVAYVLVSWGE